MKGNKTGIAIFILNAIHNMKTLLLIVLSLLYFSSTYAQKRGYKEIQLGCNLDSIEKLNHYIIRPSQKQDEVFLLDSTATICRRKIEYIKVVFNLQHVIQQVNIYTDEFHYNDYKSSLVDYEDILNGLVLTLGGATWTNLGKETNGTKQVLWDFKDANIIFVYSVKDISTFSTDINLRYSFTWGINTPNKMW